MGQGQDLHPANRFVERNNGCILVRQHIHPWFATFRGGTADVVNSLLAAQSRCPLSLTHVSARESMVIAAPDAWARYVLRHTLTAASAFSQLRGTSRRPLERSCWRFGRAETERRITPGIGRLSSGAALTLNADGKLMHG